MKIYKKDPASNWPNVKAKLPILPIYANVQPVQDNVVRQYNPVTNPDERYTSEEEARKLRVAKREKELQEYYSQPGMVSGMKRKPTPSEVKAHAESSVSYNDKLYNDPVGTLGPDIAMSVIPELMMLKGPQQVISRGLNKLNPFKSYNPWDESNYLLKFGNYEILPKPNPTAHYRNIGGKEGYLNIIKRGEVAPPVYKPIPKTAIFNEGITLYPKQFNRAFYAGQGEFSPALRYKGPYAVEANIPMSNGFGGNWGYAPDPNKLGFKNVPTLHPEVRLLKQYRIPKTEKVLFQKELPKTNSKFISEIDWAKWNPDTPKYPELINEYNTIEESAKKAGTWMKYSDGSKFNGTPEQFIQMKSKNAAAFAGNSELAEKMYRNRLYRGSHQHINDFKNRDRNDYALFTTSSKENAIAYAHEGKGRIFRPEDAQWSGDGLYELAIPQNLPTVIGNGGGNNSWKLLNWDEKIAQGTTKFPNPYEYNQLWSKADAHLKDLELMTKSKDFDPKISNIVPGKKYLSTDVYANYVKNPNNKEAVARIEDVVDTMGDRYLFPTTVHAIDTDRVPVKSLFYNNGMFDMTNPNIYKALLPVGLGTAAYSKVGKQQDKKTTIYKR